MSATNGQERLDEFAEEVKKLKVSGGLANPERTGTTLGVLLMVVGGFIVVILSFAKRGETEFADSSAGLSEIIQATNNVWTAMFGVALILLGLAIWIRNSLTRYFRYWLTRLIYEDRANTDRLIEALEALKRDQPVGS